MHQLCNFESALVQNVSSCRRDLHLTLKAINKGVKERVEPGWQWCWWHRVLAVVTSFGSTCFFFGAQRHKIVPLVPFCGYNIQPSVLISRCECFRHRAARGSDKVNLNWINRRLTDVKMEGSSSIIRLLLFWLVSDSVQLQCLVGNFVRSFLD